ncbi:MAG: hypothetical protein ABW185_27155 [Sedimenticola sp.]
MAQECQTVEWGDPPPLRMVAIRREEPNHPSPRLYVAGVRPLSGPFSAGDEAKTDKSGAEEPDRGRERYGLQRHMIGEIGFPGQIECIDRPGYQADERTGYWVKL